jgi:hypothetical protein
LDLGTGGRLGRLHIRVHLWWVSRWARRLLVVTGERCPLTKSAVAVVEQHATTEPHCSRGVQPGGICVHMAGTARATARADSRRSGVGLAPGPQALPMPAAALVLYIFLAAACQEARCHSVSDQSKMCGGVIRRIDHST